MMASLATSRDKRNNAGSRMLKLVEVEEEDDFYKTTYGGFLEESGDEEYKYEESESDDVDTDFNIDENDELTSEDEDGEPKRKRRVITKAYKEPKKKLSKSSPMENKPKTEEEKHKVVTDETIERKLTRESTVKRTKAAELRQKEREAKMKIMKELMAKRQSEETKLTQEELLAEAKITEEMNLKCLESYQRLELEKKKVKLRKQTYKGPIIRYQSVTMPLIKEIPTEMEKINVDGDSSEEKEKIVEKPRECCSRTFITFTDNRVFKKYFPQTKPKTVMKHFCPITRQPAKYFDFITQLPYAILQAFFIIREAYYQQLELKADRKLPQVAVWLEHRRKMKELQQLQKKAAASATTALLEHAKEAAKQ